MYATVSFGRTDTGASCTSRQPTDLLRGNSTSAYISYQSLFPERLP
jgi:hypothetical protein